MRNILFCMFVLAAVSTAVSCGGQASAPTSSAGTPAEAYKALFEAVKSKDTERIKSLMSKTTQSFAAAASEKQSKPIEQVYENGFTATTFADSLPEIRDERIKDNFAAVEVWNAKDSRWEDIPWVLEDGGWKLAFGDMFANTYKSPGPGRDFKEKEAANAMAPKPTPASPGANTNVIKTIPAPKTVNANGR